MLKIILAPTLVIAMGVSAISPAKADPAAPSAITTTPISIALGLLLPAVQTVREAAR